MASTQLHEKAINTIRFLAADAVQKANSGHPGLPMGMASAAYVLFARHMKYNPADPQWPDRDRFILSAGHGSMLLYALLHLSGYDLPLEELKQFRQWGSKTPGHPEYGLTPGVEMTTGPLGQGFSTGVGMAIATEHLAALYNREEHTIVDHFIYAIVSDGDLMEGVASEAASLAGHLRLGRLIYLYDDNRISIDGSTDLAFTEDRAARFEAYGWHVEQVADVNDLEALDRAIEAAKADERPSLIVTRSHIGYGLPTKQDTSAAHGEPPGQEELAGAKDKLGWPQEPSFLVPEDVREHFFACAQRNLKVYESWQERMARYGGAYPELSAQFKRTLKGTLPAEVKGKLPVFDPDAKGMATRASSGKVLNALAPFIPELIGGSADLTGSNKTALQGETAFSLEDRAGRYLHFGVREHAMGAILNGLSLHGGLIPFGGTFLVFSDYMRGSVRLAALMKQRVIYVFTHDSIGLGEDGPTHQPIEQLTALRTIPNMVVLRPADANEVAQAWMSALEREAGPTALSLTRQALPTIDRAKYGSAEGLKKGAYTLAELGEGPPQLILMASGSEVEIILEAGEKLASKGISVRMVSFPSWELFEAQSAEYRQQVLPAAIRARVAIEAGITLGWERWVGDGGAVIGLNHFGESAPYEELYERFGLTADNVVQKAQEVLARIEPSGS
ncbi:MAG: transketolase [Anaerolineales bacterium]|nr:transketolase [Anaerolineales bacterium]